MTNILFISFFTLSLKKHCKEHVCTKQPDIYLIVSSSQTFTTGNEGLKDSQVFKSLKVKTRALKLRQGMLRSDSKSLPLLPGSQRVCFLPRIQCLLPNVLIYT